MVLTLTNSLTAFFLILKTLSMSSLSTSTQKQISLSTIGLLLVFLCTYDASAQLVPVKERPRIVITADPELDDNNSLIRFLLYSSDLEIEGLVYASSGFHWKGDGKGTKWYVPGREYSRFGLDTCPCESWRWAKDERFIHNAVETYAKVYPNLKIHNPEYPDPKILLSKIRYGNIEFDGDISKDTPGSDLIKSLMLDNEPGHLFITAWGGHSTIARALKSIKDQYEFTEEWDNIRNKVSRKVILLPSGDQDDTYAKYIKPNWPDIEYRQFRNSPNYGYGAQLRAVKEDSVFLTSAWMKENVSDRGPLGKIYRVWGDGKQMVKGDVMDYFGIAGYTNEQLRKMGYVVWMPVQEKGSWLGEGDNHTFMNMPANGLRAFEDASWGGWGGLRPLKENMNDLPWPDFFPAAQRDFAARLKWSVTPKYTDANHAPAVTVQGPLEIVASSWETIRLNANVTDHDGNKIAIRWWQLHVGSYKGNAAITDENSARAKVFIPKDAVPGQTLHIIVETTDDGVPSMTAYQR